MSEEEHKIRAELEREIERGLEEELKDAICRLSLDLHRLHLQKRSRPHRQIDVRQVVTTLVKITTRTAGGCLMQVCETKTDVLDGEAAQSTPRTATPAAPGTKQKKKTTTTTRSLGGGTGGRSYASTQTSKKQLELGWKY